MEKRLTPYQIQISTDCWMSVSKLQFQMPIIPSLNMMVKRKLPGSTPDVLPPFPRGFPYDERGTLSTALQQPQRVSIYGTDLLRSLYWVLLALGHIVVPQMPFGVPVKASE